MSSGPVRSDQKQISEIFNFEAQLNLSDFDNVDDFEDFESI